MNRPESPRRSRPHWPIRVTLRSALHAPARERATVLLMVVGVLALLAIIGVVYATLGRADRVASATVVKDQRVGDQVADVAAYLAGVVGDATLAVYPEATKPANGFPSVIDRTRGYTYPYTDDYLLSVRDHYNQMNIGQLRGPNGRTAQLGWFDRFSPTGSNTVAWPAGALPAIDPRNHGDPYLAVLEPEWLGLPNEQGSTPVRLQDRHDWRHISVFAPRGNFISLNNLRPGYGGFSAEPGFKVDAHGRPRMSNGLTLYDHQGLPYDPTSNPDNVKLPNGQIANPDIPAHWSNNQERAFKPMVAEATYSGGGNIGPSDYGYIFNQWADTDGDGFADARWFEITDFDYDPNNANSVIAHAIVPGKGRIRLFVAARCIDSSSMVNVNTDDDFLLGPVSGFDPTTLVISGPKNHDEAFPPGLTPGDIDISRVFNLSDITISLRQAGETMFPYAGLPSLSSTFSESATSDYTQYDKAAARDIGGGAYAGVYATRWRGASTGAAITSLLPVRPDATARAHDYDIFAAEPRSGRSSADFNAKPPNQRAFLAPYDLADELELRAFFGVNDSSTFSRLEAAAGGRTVGTQHPSFSPLRDNRPTSLELTGRDQFSGSQMFPTGGGRGQAPSTLLSVFSDIRHLLTTVSGARPMKDGGVAPNYSPDHANLGAALPPDASTDVSYALKIIREWGEKNPVPTTPSTEYKNAVQLIFTLYVNALAPYTDDDLYNGIWSTPTAYPPLPFHSGLCYGGNPERAILMAAHMTANLIDAFDRDRALDSSGHPAGDDRNDPTALALHFNRSTINVPTPFDDFHKRFADLRLPDTRLPAALSQLSSSRVFGSQSGAVNVYGVEVQPFLTEIAAYFLYTDAPEITSGGDSDHGNIHPGPTDPRPPTITIKMHPDINNPDFIGEVIAFQVHNPFDQDIVLYDPSVGSAASPSYVDRSKFYLEYSGRYYSFGLQKEDATEYEDVVPSGRTSLTRTLHAGETRVFYAINPGTLDDIGQRIKNINMGTRAVDKLPQRLDAQYRALAKDWINHQLKEATLGTDSDPQQLTQVFPTTFAAYQGEMKPDVHGNNQHEMDLWGENDLSSPSRNEHLFQATESQRRVAFLWRVVRSQGILPDPIHYPGATSDQAIGGPNNPTNDLLVDRLRDPQTNNSGHLFNARSASGDHVSGTAGGEELGTDADIGDNTGFSVAVWASIRRPTDTPTDLTVSPPTLGGTVDSSRRPIRGVLPPWCLEAKSDNLSPVFSLNKSFAESPLDQGNRGNYNGQNGRYRFFKELMTATAPINNTEIGKTCNKKTSNPIPDTRDMRKYAEVAVEYHAVGEDTLGGGPYRRSRNAALFSRSGDFLLPLAVGPQFDPSRDYTQLASGSAPGWTGGDPASPVFQLEAKWMTLSESLALACAYYSPDNMNDPFYRFGEQDTTLTPHGPAGFDRGHLVLDRFVPYLLDANNKAQPLGSGVPFALGIIDQFRAAVGVSSTPTLIDNQIRPENQAREFAYGGSTSILGAPQPYYTTSLIRGLINVNTAFLNGLRPLPMVSPEEDPSGLPNQVKPWMSGVVQYPGATVAPILYDPTVVSRTYDMAAIIKVWRDKSVEEMRKPDPGSTLQTVSLSPTSPTASSTPRADRTGILGLRESLAIKSLGELAAMNFLSTTGAHGVPTYDPDKSMFRFALAEPAPVAPFVGQRLSGWLNVLSSGFYDHTTDGRVDARVPNQYTPTGGQAIQIARSGQLPGGYQDKLAIVNALTNTASVRSDIFTVYFVIHGYTPEDCDIPDNQPMVPSIARRYVMVVDRSNVINKGDKPRVLMLKEVPMAQ